MRSRDQGTATLSGHVLSARGDGPHLATGEVVVGFAPLQARCHLGRGGVYERMGQDHEARGELTYAMAMPQAMQMRYWLRR
jgi:hypothetical protein